jgi:hypothetical protein
VILVESKIKLNCIIDGKGGTSDASPLTKLNSVALIPKRTISTERPPLIGEISANLRAIAQAVSRRLPTAAARVLWDFVMDKTGAGVGFLREVWFPLPIYIPSASPQSSSLSPEAGTIGQEWPQCQ